MVDIFFSALTFMYVTISDKKRCKHFLRLKMIGCSTRTIVALSLLTQPRKESLAVRDLVPYFAVARYGTSFYLSR